MTRYLRFAAAGFFALLTLALIGLWVRSYYWIDIVYGPVSEAHTLALDSRWGGIAWQLHKPHSPNESRKWKAYSSQRPAREAPPPTPDETLFGFGLVVVMRSIYLYLPHWFLAASSLALAALLAFNRTWRFTVRALLIATTLLAAVLGMGVYLL